jgi:hypothetical protein
VLCEFAPPANRREERTILVDLGDRSYISQCPNCRSTAVSAEMDVDFHFRCYECFARIVPRAAQRDPAPMRKLTQAW